MRLQWDVLDWNQTAIDFYQGLGAQFLDEWRIMRVNDQAIGSLAKLAEEPARLSPAFASSAAASPARKQR